MDFGQLFQLPKTASASALRREKERGERDSGDEEDISLLSMAMQQEPKLEVPTIYKAYVSGLCKGISPQNMALYGTVPPI